MSFVVGNVLRFGELSSSWGPVQYSVMRIKGKTFIVLAGSAAEGGGAHLRVDLHVSVQLQLLLGLVLKDLETRPVQASTSAM